MVLPSNLSSILINHLFPIHGTSLIKILKLSSCHDLRGTIFPILAKISFLLIYLVGGHTYCIYMELEDCMRKAVGQSVSQRKNK